MNETCRTNPKLVAKIQIIFYYCENRDHTKICLTLWQWYSINELINDIAIYNTFPFDDITVEMIITGYPKVW